MKEVLEELRSSWSWIGLDPKSVLAENAFGNLIIEDQLGRYWRLCPEEVSCTIIAESRKDLDQLMTDENFCVDWEMRVLVDAGIKAFGVPAPGSKFCLKIPRALGGSYSLENIGTAPLKELIGFSGDLAFQIKDLPDGAQVELRVVDT